MIILMASFLIPNDLIMAEHHQSCAQHIKGKHFSEEVAFRQFLTHNLNTGTGQCPHAAEGQCEKVLRIHL